jgi:UDP-N-acetylmuramoyl-tripeptide--D-alanyl-D-alanine ligase
MLELGGCSAELHEECGRVAAGCGLSALVTVGGEPARRLGLAAVGEGLAPSALTHVATSGEAADVAAALVRPGDLVLVKGSRGVAAERVVERLAQVFPA